MKKSNATTLDKKSKEDVDNLIEFFNTLSEEEKREAGLIIQGFKLALTLNNKDG